MGTERDMEGLKNLLEPRHLIRFPIKTATHTEGVPNKPLVPYPLSCSPSPSPGIAIATSLHRTHTSEVRQRRLPCAASLCGPKKLF